MASGLMRYLHLEEHSRAAHLQKGTSISLTAPGEMGHDENNCAVCAALQLPMPAAGYTPLLVFLGLFVAFLTLLAQRLMPQRQRRTSGCRGPPLI